MIEPNPTASTEPPRPDTGSPSLPAQVIRTRPVRWTALAVAALVASYVGGTILFRTLGYRKGYRAGYESVGFYEGKAIADSMIGDASRSLLTAAGLVPGPDQYRVWLVARFNLVHPSELYRYGTTPGHDTMKVPRFSAIEPAPVGRSYRNGSDGRIHYVDH